MIARSAQSRESRELDAARSGSHWSIISGLVLVLQLFPICNVYNLLSLLILLDIRPHQPFNRHLRRSHVITVVGEGSNPLTVIVTGRRTHQRLEEDANRVSAC
jgi:hypothetical protein